MLILARKRHEQILIGDDIQITVTEIAGGVVRLGIDAPKNTRILRRELCPEPPRPTNTLRDRKAA